MSPHNPSLAPSPSPAAITDRYPIEQLIARWSSQTGRARAHLVGLDGALLACALADVRARLGRRLCVVCPSQESASRLATNIELFARSPHDPDHDVALYPEYDVGPFHQVSADRAVTMRRLATLHALCCEQPPSIVITSAAAFVRRTLPKESMIAMTRTWRVEDELDNASLREHLTRCGYTEVPVVEDAGTFAVRGDIVDIYPGGEEHPLRVERWGDEVAEIRSFHPQTQRTIEERDEVTVYPVRQEILDKRHVSIAHERLHALGGKRQTPTSRVNSILSDLRAGMHFIGVDSLMPALHDHLEDLGDYLPEDTIVVLVRPDAIDAALQELWSKRVREHAAIADASELFFEPEAYYRSPEDFAQWTKDLEARMDVGRASVASREPPQQDEDESREDGPLVFRARSNDDIVRLRKSSHGVEQMIQALGERLAAWRERYGRVCVTCRTKSQATRLEELLRTFYPDLDTMQLEPPIDVSEPMAAPAHIIEIYHAPLTQGFRSEMMGVCVISGAEIFGQRVSTRSPKDAGRAFSEAAAISHFKDLTVGDLVVHVDYGIGQYRGLVHMDIDGIGNDFLQIDYADDDKIFLPVYRLGRVQRYIGGAHDARLDKLRGNSWEKTKERVKENIRAIAGELLSLYAKREMAKGYAFSPPDDLYRAFEESFPYEETPDQARAIEDTLRDMTSPRPMDRLVCGDVGFGKTEVAIRAAMKAVVDGKQVAVLVPTTILAEQHLISFRDRMQEHGAIIECLSRFRSSKEARDIIARTNEGKVDVLIGTHRLLNKEIVFQDLGLLVVDEEQRFGVTHKERIKKLRANIDVLTLSATPIPRTLQMSLLGIRDLSIIATPPHDRLSVRTHVARFSDGIVREAVIRELGRGGQVFFVHNRVATIDEMASHLKELLPEARIGVGHGQMGETKLEEMMVSYLQGKINVLLCTSIIESGLDIPNANTIVVNRADNFGLSQLYQLRGRVGRGKERAYAYLLIPARRVLPKDAEKRLDVIQTHTDLGSGFHVASYDLEIRGAGSLLGDDQSGHVAAVGLDLYNELLEEAVDDIRGQDHDSDIEPEVNIPVDSHIPDSYIPATGVRLMFYKRLSLARTQEELGEIIDEMIDRFGDAPRSVDNLRQIIAVKIGLRALRFRRLDAGPAAISMEIDETTPMRPETALELVHESRGRLSLTQDMKLVFKLRPDESAAPLKTAKRLVDTLLASVHVGG